LHLPVGGRRFRPTLEDLIEFLITERLVKGKQGWQQALGASRNQFSVKQMRALIRRFPTDAEAAVREFGAKSALMRIKVTGRNQAQATTRDRYQLLLPHLWRHRFRNNDQRFMAPAQPSATVHQEPQHRP